MDGELLQTILEQYGLAGVASFVLGLAMVYMTRSISNAQMSITGTQDALARIALQQQGQNERQDTRNEKMQAELNEVRTKLAHAEGVQTTLQKVFDSERLAWGKERSEMQAKVAALREQVLRLEKVIAELQRQIDSKQSENAQLRAEKARVEAQLEAKQELIAQLKGQVKTLDVQNASQAGMITQQVRDLEELRREESNKINRSNHVTTAASTADTGTRPDTNSGNP